MTDYSRTRNTLASIWTYVKGQLATLTGVRTGVLACEQDLDKAFRILDVIQPPGVIFLVDESHAGPDADGDNDAMDRRSKLVLVAFVRKLSTVELNMSALQTLEDQIVTLIDFQLYNNVLYTFESSKNFPIDRWSGICASRITITADDN